MKKIIALSLLMMLVLPACAFISLTPTETVNISPTTITQNDISGTYTLEGTNFDGTAYTGEVSISGSGISYNLAWSIGQSQTQTGTADFDGTQLIGRWHEGDYSGDIIYTLQPDGSFTGTWTADGYTGQGTETLTPQR